MSRETKTSKNIELDFYQRANVTRVARDLLGKILWTNFHGKITAGVIVETEAYCGATDRACHAFSNKRTPRTATMYLPGGHAYVYFVYGMHHLFNIVTNKAEQADAVLIRAIEPYEGLAVMQRRRKMQTKGKELTGGPARLTQALGIEVKHDKELLSGPRIWLSAGDRVTNGMIRVSKRIGVEYAGEDANLPWRFYIKGNKYVSK